MTNRIVGIHQGDRPRENTVPMVVISQLSPIYVAFAVPGRYLTGIGIIRRRRR